MCVQFTFHHQFRIDTGRLNLSKRLTVFFLPLDPMDKEQKDPDTIDLEAPRLGQYMHKAWKKHQNTVYWVDIKLAQKKGLKFYQTRSNAIILHETLPAYCIPKVVRDPPILSVSQVLCLRHMIGEIFLRNFVHLETDLFSSIMFESRFTKFRIFQEEIFNPFILPLGASFSQIMGNMMVSLSFGLPTSMAMRSPHLTNKILN